MLKRKIKKRIILSASLIMIFIVYMVLKNFVGLFTGREVIEGYLVSVKNKKIISKIIAVAEVQAREKRSPTFSGYGKVKKISVKVGTKVKPGDHLVSIESTDVERKYKTYHSKLKEVKTKLKERKDTYHNTLILYKKDLASQSKVLKTKNDYFKYKAETYTNALNKFKEAEQEIKNLKIYSKLGGYVTEVNRYQGDMLVKNEPILVITKLDDLFARFYVSKAYRNKLKKNMIANYYYQYSNKKALAAATGKITLISGFVNKKGIEIELDFNPKSNDDRRNLLNERMRIEIILNEKENVPAIPLSSIYIDQDNNSYVYITENNIAIKKVVKLGLIGNEYAEVKEGLNSNDKIIANPASFIQEGMFFKKRGRK